MSNFYTEPFVSAGEMEFPSEPYITAQPQNHTATGPEEYVLKVIAAGAVSYQWEVFDGMSWSVIQGATSDTLTITIDPSMNGWRYRVLVTGADGSTVTSKAAQIAVRGIHECTLEGAIVTFTGPARIKSLEVEINAVQSGSGDPSPTNIRPISGWDAVNVVRTGKNLIETTLTSQTRNGITYTVNSDGTIQAQGTASALSIVNIGSYVVREDATYYASGCPSGGSASTYRMYCSWGSNEIGNGSQKALTAGTTVTLQIAIASGTTVNATYKPMLCKLSDGTAYEPYNGTTYPITLPNTVYGGTIKDGVLTVTHAIVDMGDLTWNIYSAGVNTFRTLIPTKAYGDINLNCSCYKTEASTFTNMTNASIRGTSGNSYVYARDDNYEGKTATEYKQGITGQQLVYELATPITYQLTPTEVQTILGTNNIWADCGDIRVTIIR